MDGDCEFPPFPPVVIVPAVNCTHVKVTIEEPENGTEYFNVTNPEVHVCEGEFYNASTFNNYHNNMIQ
jgi:hypothetical protein